MQHYVVKNDKTDGSLEDNGTPMYGSIAYISVPLASSIPATVPL